MVDLLPNFPFTESEKLRVQRRGVRHDVDVQQVDAWGRVRVRLLNYREAFTFFHLEL